MTRRSTDPAADRNGRSTEGVDRRIVAELRRTGREPLVIARETYPPVTTLRYRIRALEKQVSSMGTSSPPTGRRTIEGSPCSDSPSMTTPCEAFSIASPRGSGDVFVVETFATVPARNEYRYLV